MNPQSPVPDDDPLMIAWKAYIATADFKNSKHWAMRIRAERTDYEIMPFEQREQHVMGSLWAAFAAGFTLSAESETPEQAKPPYPREWDDPK
jgi:hypothetical protein